MRGIFPISKVHMYQFSLERHSCVSSCECFFSMLRFDKLKRFYPSEYDKQVLFLQEKLDFTLKLELLRLWQQMSRQMQGFLTKSTSFLSCHTIAAMKTLVLV